MLGSHNANYDLLDFDWWSQLGTLDSTSGGQTVLISIIIIIICKCNVFQLFYIIFLLFETSMLYVFKWNEAADTSSNAFMLGQLQLSF